MLIRFKIIVYAATIILSLSSIFSNELNYNKLVEDYDNEILNENLIKKAINQPSIENYIKLLLLNNTGLKASFQKFKASTLKIFQVKSLPDPKLVYTNFIEEIQTRTGPQTFKLSLSQTFPWFGKLKLKEDIAYKQSEMLWKNVLRKRLDLILNFKIIYYEYAYLNHLTQITKSNLMLLKQLEPMVQTKVQAGDIQKDLIRLQVEISKVENELLSLREKRPAINSKLLALLNLKNKILLPWPEISVPIDDINNLDLLKSSLLQKNPFLQQVEEQIEQEAHKLKLSEIASMPNISLGVTYINTEDSIMDNVSGSGDDPLGVNITFNIPIWRSKYKAKTEESKALISSYEALLQDNINWLTSKLEFKVYEYEDIKRQIDLYKNSLIPKAKQALKIIETAYSSGKATLLDLIDALRILLHFEKIFWRNLTTYYKVVAEIDNICGENKYETN